MLQYDPKIRYLKRDKQIFLTPSGNIRGNNAQNNPNSPKSANAKGSNRPGHDVEDLIVFPGCLEGEKCHDGKCKSAHFSLTILIDSKYTIFVVI